MKNLLVLLLISAGLAPSAVLAQHRGWYVGGALGQATAKDLCAGMPAGITVVSCDESAPALKGFGGYAFGRHFAIEGTLIQTGSFTGRFAIGGSTVDASVSATSLGGAAVGILPLGDAVALFGKAGIARTEARAAVAGSTTYIGAGATGAHIGAGATFAFTRRWALRVEWERLHRGEYDLVSAGAQFRF